MAVNSLAPIESISHYAKNSGGWVCRLREKVLQEVPRLCIMERTWMSKMCSTTIKSRKRPVSNGQCRCPANTIVM